MLPLPLLSSTSDAQSDAVAALPPCLARRDFLAQSGLLAVGALLASACGDGQLGGTPTGPGGSGGPSGGNDSVTVQTADYASLGTVGGIARLAGTARPVAVVRSTASTYRAFSMICTHEGTIIEIVGGGNSFRCPNHGAEFAATGRRTGGQTTSDLVELQVTAGTTPGTITVRY